MAAESREGAYILNALESGYKQVGEGWMHALTTLCRNVISRHGYRTISLLRAAHQSTELVRKVSVSQFNTVMVCCIQRHIEIASFKYRDVRHR